MTVKQTMTFEEYKKHLAPYPVFGEMHLSVGKEKEGYKIVVSDREVYTFIDEKGSKQKENMSTRIITMYTNKEGVIHFIEHGFDFFTKTNKELVIHTAMFIGKQIADIEKHVNQ